jgi:hypothetical protein
VQVVLSIHITALFLAWDQYTVVHTYTTLACIKNKKQTPRTAPLEQSSKMMMSSWFEIVELNAHTLPALTITTSCLVYLDKE